MAWGTWTISVGGTTLGDTSCIVEPDGSVRGGANIVAFPGYGAPAPVFLNLANAQIVRSYLITKEWATDTLAEAFRQTANATYGGVATVIISHVDYSGVTTSWTFSNAKVEIEVLQRIGMVTITRVTFTAGS
jgi:hypothetical protein